MTVQLNMVGDVVVLTPDKNLVGGDETNAVLIAVEEIIAARPAKVVLDLGEISFVSSLGVGLLRRASIMCANSGGWLRLARIGKIVENTLHVTGLIIYFETFDTVEEALKAPQNDLPRWAGERTGNHPPRRPGA